MSLMDNLSQMRFPEPFRIGPPAWSPELQAGLERLLRPAPTDSATMDVVALLKGICTELFRLREKMLKPGTTDPREEFQRPFRHLEAVWDFLKESGVEIVDHTGTRYDAGLQIEKMSSEPTPGITRETVIQTYEPTIYFKESMIQRGKVIVGTPIVTPPAGPADAPSADQK